MCVGIRGGLRRERERERERFILVLFRARESHLLFYDRRDCDMKKSAVLDSGASVNITSERHRAGQRTDSPEMVQGISGTTHAWPTCVQWHTKTDCGVPHLLQTEAGFEDFKQLYMPNAPDQILSLSQLVEAGYVPHFRPSAQKSWLTTTCKKRISVVLIDGVWRMPLWQDQAHPQVLRSGNAIAGALRPQRTISAADRHDSFICVCDMTRLLILLTHSFCRPHVPGLHLRDMTHLFLIL